MAPLQPCYRQIENISGHYIRPATDETETVP